MLNIEIFVKDEPVEQKTTDSLVRGWGHPEMLHADGRNPHTDITKFPGGCLGKIHQPWVSRVHTVVDSNNHLLPIIHSGYPDPTTER